MTQFELPKKSQTPGIENIPIYTCDTAYKRLA